jgi:hypothetical protein
MTDFVSGRLYFIKDEFFEVVDEKYLKTNKGIHKDHTIMLLRILLQDCCG